ncbi:sugar phosphate isomerase/epimerase [Phototrophicus methaneseepsis]|uniref:Sugar phosphate isomerase/epimerase n=1 Tax=Phototrophicus methaneseepsis TaxID=2710758 RepID=A0A7S8EAG9_9CHLR|nr:sugar phosphate isomerase/epimerase [Phototrophicus methaneseepsis]QPC83336.1 sugar phosphate isomerase/epimerase [Phototrophicus methaneseepsis]
MASKALPVGASYNVIDFPANVDWILESDRDLELYSYAGFLDDSSLRDSFKDVPRLLNGYTGRFGLHGPMTNFAVHNKEIRAAVIKEFTEMLHICGEVGATHMVLHSPYLSLGAPFPEPIASLMTTNPARSVLEEIIPIAESVNCVIMLENIMDTRPDMHINLVRAINSPWLKVSVDTGHAFVMHRWGEAPTPDYWIRQAGPLLGHVHLQDTDGYTDRHWAPGDGAVPWIAVFEALSALEEQPRMVLEISADKLERGFNYLAERDLVK